MRTINDRWDEFVELLGLEGDDRLMETIKFAFFNGADSVLVIGEDVGPVGEAVAEEMVETFKLECRGAFIEYWKHRGIPEERVMAMDRHSYGPPPDRGSWLN